MIEEFDRRFCIIILGFMFLASFIIGVGLLNHSDQDTDEAVMAMSDSYEIQTLIPEKEAYDPIEHAKEQLELDRLAKENGCVVVIPEAAESENTSSADVNHGVLRRYYQVNLNNDQQDVVFALCEHYDLPCELALGVIEADRSRSEAAAGHAVMCLNTTSAGWYAEAYELTDMSDFSQNLTCGIIMLSEYYHRYPDVHKIAMCYEMGESAAIELWNSGITETEYSRSVALSINTLKLRE